MALETDSGHDVRVGCTASGSTTPKPRSTPCSPEQYGPRTPTPRARKMLRKTGDEGSQGCRSPRPRPPLFSRMVSEQHVSALARRPQTVHATFRPQPSPASACIVDAGVSPTRVALLPTPPARAHTAPQGATRRGVEGLTPLGRQQQQGISADSSAGAASDCGAPLPRGSWDRIRTKLEDEFASLGCCRKQFRELSTAVWRHAVELNQMVVDAVGQLGCEQPLRLMLQLWDMFLMMAETSLGKSFSSQLITTMEGLHDQREGLEAELNRTVIELKNADISAGLLRSGLMAARDELRAEKRQVKVHERASEGLMRTSTTVVESLMAENKALKEALSEFQRLPARLSELQRENRQLQRMSGPERDSLVEGLREMERRVFELQGELRQVNDKAERQRIAMQEAVSEAERLGKMAETAKAQLQAKERIVKMLESDNRSLIQREKDSAIAAKEIELARQTAERRINELHEARVAEVAEADKRVKEALLSATVAEQRLNALDTTTSDKMHTLEEQLKSMKQERMLVGMRLAAAEARHRVQYGDKATVVSKLHSELEGMHETKNRYKMLHMEALQEVEDVREEMAKRATAWRSEREELEHEHLKAMDENRAYYELQLEERERRVADLNKELESVRHASQAQLEVTKREEQKLKQGVMQADAAVKDLQNAVKEMKEQEVYTSYDISRLTEALARKDAEHREKESEMASSIEVLQKRVQTLTKELGNNSTTLSHRMDELLKVRHHVLELEKELEVARGSVEEKSVRAVSRNLSRAESVRYVLSEDGVVPPPHASFFEEKAHENEVHEGMLNMSAAYRAALRILEEVGEAASTDSAQMMLVDRVEEKDLQAGMLSFSELSDKLGAAMLELGHLRREAADSKRHCSVTDAESAKLQEDHKSRFLENQKLRVALAGEEEKNRMLAEQVVKLWQAGSKDEQGAEAEEEEGAGSGKQAITRVSSLRGGATSRTRSDVGMVKGKALAAGGRTRSQGGRALTRLARRNTSESAEGLLQAGRSALSKEAD